MLRIGLTIIQLFAALAIIALVLLQRGKGADAGAGFGAGASGTVFGARGARTALSRATAIFAAIFMLNSLALAYMGTRQVQEKPKTLLDEAAAPAAPAVPPSSGATVPAPAAQTPAPAVAPPAVEAPQGGASAPATGSENPTPKQ
jgi:preprotein translocase subunit SecG